MGRSSLFAIAPAGDRAALSPWKCVGHVGIVTFCSGEHLLVWELQQQQPTGYSSTRAATAATTPIAIRKGATAATAAATTTSTSPAGSTSTQLAPGDGPPAG